MKNLSAGMQAHVAQAVTTLAFGMRVERIDGDVTGWTNHPRRLDVTVNGDSLTLEPSNAIDISSIARSVGMGVDNLEATVVDFDDVLSKIDLLEGRWDGARFTIFQFNWMTPADGLIPWISGKFGNASPRLGSYVIELRDLRQELQSDITRVVQANCDYRLGDANCSVDLEPFTHPMTVTAVGAGQRVFTASALAQPADYFGQGEVRWLTGLNAGLRSKVYAHEAGGVVTLDLPLLRPIDIGDTADIIAGCRRRREDCRDKFDNVLNYPGADSAPTTDKMVSRANPDAEYVPPAQVDGGP